MSTFQVGDIVKITYPNPIYRGKKGIILSTSPYAMYCLYVQIGNTKTFWACHEVEKVNEV